MQQLHLVGFTTDHKGLILGTRRGSEEGGYVVTLDRAFVEQVEELLRLQASESAGDTGSAGAGNGVVPLRRPKAESRLTPRQVQALLRTGRSVSEVAEEAGMSEDWVGRFAPPVLAEQARVIERAVGLTYIKPRIGPSTQPLGESVIWNLADRGIVLSGRAVEDAWTGFQQPDGAWVVRVSYLAERRRQHADWSVDMVQGMVKALNKLGNELGYVEPGRRRPAALPPPTPVSASAQRAATAPPRPPLPAPLPARSSGRLSLLSTTSPPGSRSSGSSAPSATSGRTSPVSASSPAPSSPEVDRGGPGIDSIESDRPNLGMPRDVEDAVPDRPTVRDLDRPRSDRLRAPSAGDADDSVPDRHRAASARAVEGSVPEQSEARSAGDGEVSRSTRPKARMPREAETAEGAGSEGRADRADRQAPGPKGVRSPSDRKRARSKGVRSPSDRQLRPRPLQARAETPAEVPPADEPLPDQTKPRRERPLRAPSRIVRDDPPTPARRPLSPPRLAERTPPASDRSGPPAPLERPRISTPSTTEKTRAARLPEVMPNNHGTPPPADAAVPPVVPRRPLRAKRIVIDDLAEDELEFAQPPEQSDDPVTAPVPAVDLAFDGDLDGPFARAPGQPGQAGPAHDQVLIRAGQAGTPVDPSAPPAGPASANPEDRRGRRRLRRRGQDPS